MVGGGVFVPGIPRPQGSKRRGRGGQLFESSRHVGPWRDSVRTHAVAHMRSRRRGGWPVEGGPFTGPVRLELEFVFERPKRKRDTSAAELRTMRYSAGRPDLDKLVRAVLDALEGVVYAADAQVVELVARKVYGVEPGVSIAWAAA